MFHRIKTIAIASNIKLFVVSATGKPDTCSKPHISLEAKLLMGFKLLAYGVSANAFRNYFQIGERIANYCEEHLISLLCESKELTDVYLCEMNAYDVKQVVQLHEEAHGMSGIVGSLDCTHRP